MYCRNCGSKNLESDHYCRNCGKELNTNQLTDMNTEADKKRANKLTTIALVSFYVIPYISVGLSKLIEEKGSIGNTFSSILETIGSLGALLSIALIVYVMIKYPNHKYSKIALIVILSSIVVSAIIFIILIFLLMMTCSAMCSQID